MEAKQQISIIKRFSLKKMPFHLFISIKFLTPRSTPKRSPNVNAPQILSPYLCLLVCFFFIVKLNSKQQNLVFVCLESN